MLRRVTLACALALIVGGVSRAEIIDGYSAARNDLYTGGTFPAGTPPTPNPTFFSPYNYSGVGWVPSAGPGTKLVTMISPIDFICAQHYLPGTGTTIAFRGSDGSYNPRTVAAQTQISGSDIAVGRLSSALPGTVTYYPISYASNAN